MIFSAKLFRFAVPVFASALLAQAPDGGAIYKKQCAMCHGPDGSGATSMGKTFKLRDLKSADVQGMTDAQLTDIITKGKGKMPAYGTKLGPDGVTAVVGYLRTMAKSK